jgi:hypothetical protein
MGPGFFIACAAPEQSARAFASSGWFCLRAATTHSPTQRGHREWMSRPFVGMSVGSPTFVICFERRTCQ